MKRYRDYDPFAWLYTNYWGDEYHRQAIPALDKALLRHLPKKARILDLCCGDGRITHKLSRMGYSMLGIDGSEQMLTYAQRRSPKVRFLLKDARKFELPEEFDGAISTFDSLNHIMDSLELDSVFANVFACLKPGGRFVFDLNREQAYRDFWARHSNSVLAKVVSIVNGSYNEHDKSARCDITLFRLEQDKWIRTDFRMTQRFHPLDVVLASLHRAGFRAEVLDAVTDLGMLGETGDGRDFFVAVKPHVNHG